MKTGEREDELLILVIKYPEMTSKTITTLLLKQQETIDCCSSHPVVIHGYPHLHFRSWALSCCHFGHTGSGSTTHDWRACVIAASSIKKSEIVVGLLVSPLNWRPVWTMDKIGIGYCWTNCFNWKAYSLPILLYQRSIRMFNIRCDCSSWFLSILLKFR